MSPGGNIFATFLVILVLSAPLPVMALMDSSDAEVSDGTTYGTEDNPLTGLSTDLSTANGHLLSGGGFRRLHPIPLMGKRSSVFGY